MKTLDFFVILKVIVVFGTLVFVFVDGTEVHDDGIRPHYDRLGEFPLDHLVNEIFPELVNVEQDFMLMRSPRSPTISTTQTSKNGKPKKQVPKKALEAVNSRNSVAFKNEKGFFQTGELERIEDDKSTSHVYWVIEAGERVGVFKPVLEDGGGVTSRESVSLRDGPFKEHAAHLLNPEIVPYTQLCDPETDTQAQIDGKIVSGSFQKFMTSVGNSMDFGSSNFDPESVCKIAILDIRLMNLDRHSMNILVKDKSKTSGLVPIDHALSLPPWDKLDDEVMWEWETWAPVKQQLSPELLGYIRQLNAIKDFKMLVENNIHPKEAFTNVLTTTLLKLGAEKGKTLKQIAQMMSRDLMTPEKPSLLEELRDNALSSSGTSLEQVNVELENLKKLKSKKLRKFLKKFKILAEKLMEERREE